MTQNLDTRSLQGESLPAALDRLINGVVSEGVWDKAGGSFQVVEQASPNMTVRVGSGTAGDIAVVQGEASLQGRYLVQNQDAYAGNAAADLTIAEGDASDDRIDLVVLQVYDDPFDSSGSDVAQLEVVEGTPASSPSAPTVPDNALVLAEILVSAGESTSIVDGDITDRRVQAEPDGPIGIAKVLGVAEVTSTQSGISSETDLTGLSVTVDVAAGRRVKVSVVMDVRTETSGGTIAPRIYEDATQIQRARFTADGGSEIYNFAPWVVVEPSAGEHTYKVTLAASNDVEMLAGAQEPSVLLVEDIGPA